jgi:hypothetical protein
MEAITADELTKCRRNVAEKVLFFEGDFGNNFKLYCSTL